MSAARFTASWKRAAAQGAVSWWHAPVAQLDRALVSGTKGQWFESTRAYKVGQMKRKR